jgi:cyclopropane-fatty-acyl-phospholipid synthase
MDKAKQVVERLFAESGVRINGQDPWDIRVHDDRMYARALRYKNLGLGESYMDGWWDCPRLDEFMCRILSGRIEGALKAGPRELLLSVRARLFNEQSRKKAREVVERHYDLSNRLFLSFLDPYNQYSCGYFTETDDLDRAQLNKLDLVCRKIGLHSSDHVLDIGSGWGGFAKYAAEQYGCTVTAVNISAEQNRRARALCKDLPVRILQCDYRELEETFDKIVSIGMFEHVGCKNYRNFMEVVRRCLKEGGVFLLHTIGRNESDVSTDPWINKYIFPNGMLPSAAQIGRAIDGLLVLEDWHNLGPHYDKTLMAWYRNFQKAWPGLEGEYDHRFKRMWDYYLLICAAAFRCRYNQLWQIVLTGYGTPQPSCRVS